MITRTGRHIIDRLSRTNRFTFCIGLAAFVLFVAACASPARAQDDEVVEEVPAAVAEQAQFMVSDDNFNQWVFGTQGSLSENKQRFEAMLHVQVEGVQRSCALSDDQKKKLMLAGSADIKRFFERVDLLYKRFQLIKNDQNKFNEFWQEIQPVQAIVNRGTFSENSYFKKTLKNLLTAEQISQFDSADRQRRLFNYRSKVETVVCSLDEVLSLRAGQRRQLIDVLTTPAQVPRTFGQESYSQYAVLYQASQIPEAKLKQIFDPAQIATIKKVLAQTRGFGQFLKTNGYVWDEAWPDAAGADAAARANDEPKAEPQAENEEAAP